MLIDFGTVFFANILDICNNFYTVLCIILKKGYEKGLS